MSDSLLERQQAVGEWSAEQFGTEQPPEYPLLGVGEELGELTTSVLKRAQGIDDAEKYADRVGDEAERDAIADVAIYLFDYVYRHGSVEMTDVLDQLEQRDERAAESSYQKDDDPVEAVLSLYLVFGNATTSDVIAETDSIAYDAASLLHSLQHLCDIRGFDFEACLDDALDDVLDREWDADVIVE